MKRKQERLELWQERLEQYNEGYAAERAKMDAREAIYRGKTQLDKVVENDTVKKTNHVWNITFELIEAQVDSGLMMPKVTPKRKRTRRSRG